MNGLNNTSKRKLYENLLEKVDSDINDALKEGEKLNTLYVAYIGISEDTHEAADAIFKTIRKEPNGASWWKGIIPDEELYEEDLEKFIDKIFTDRIHFMRRQNPFNRRKHLLTMRGGKRAVKSKSRRARKTKRRHTRRR